MTPRGAIGDGAYLHSFLLPDTPPEMVIACSQDKLHMFFVHGDDLTQARQYVPTVHQEVRSRQ